MDEARRLLEEVYHLMSIDEYDVGLSNRVQKYLAKFEPAPVTPSERDRLAEIAWRKFVVYYKGQLTESHFASIADASYAAADAFLKAGEKGE